MTPTYESLMAKSREFHASGDIENARKTAEIALKLKNGAPKEQEKVSGFSEFMGDAKDVVSSGASGLLKGITGLADIPGQVLSGGNKVAAWAGEKSGVMSPDFANALRGAHDGTPVSGDFVGGVADTVVPGARDYQPQTKTGEIVKTVGEFIPGALAFGGPGSLLGNAVRYALIPGVSSELAGQLTEGTKFEPYARIAAALLSGSLAGRSSGKMRPLLPRVDADDAKMAETLMKSGVKPTVGQASGSSLLRKMEGSADILPSQSDDFTRAAIKTTGTSARRASPEVMKATTDRIVKSMDDAVSGVSFTPSPQMAQEADDVVREYTRATAQGNIVPDVRNIADEIIDVATSPKPQSLNLSTLKDWRSRLGRLMKSNDPQVRDGAWGLRSIIDDATTAELTRAGRVSDVEKLATGRTQYRNFIAVSDAATRAGAEGGRISPTQLNQSVIRSQGRRNAAIGNTTELGELSRSAAGILRSEPTVLSGGARNITAQAGGSLAGALSGASINQSNPILGALIGAGLGGAGVSTGQALMRSQPVQNLMADPIQQIIKALLASGPGAAQSAQ